MPRYLMVLPIALTVLCGAGAAFAAPAFVVSFDDVEFVEVTDSVPGGAAHRLRLILGPGGTIAWRQEWTNNNGVFDLEALNMEFFLATKEARDEVRFLIKECAVSAKLLQAQPSDYNLDIRVDFISASQAAVNTNNDWLTVSMQPGVQFRCKLSKQ